MATATRIAIRHTKAMEGINERLAAIESSIVSQNGNDVEGVVTATLDYIVTLDGLTKTSREFIQSLDVADVIDAISQ